MQDLVFFRTVNWLAGCSQKWPTGRTLDVAHKAQHIDREYLIWDEQQSTADFVESCSFHWTSR
jgi:hypothetical protein